MGRIPALLRASCAVGANTSLTGPKPKMSDSAQLRFRLYLDGKIEVEEWIAVADQQAVELAPGRHANIAMSHPDKRWMVEVFDPEAPDDEACLRFGSSPDGMVTPLLVDPKDFR